MTETGFTWEYNWSEDIIIPFVKPTNKYPHAYTKRLDDGLQFLFNRARINNIIKRALP